MRLAEQRHRIFVMQDVEDHRVVGASIGAPRPGGHEVAVHDADVLEPLLLGPHPRRFDHLGLDVQGVHRASHDSSGGNRERPVPTAELGEVPAGRAEPELAQDRCGLEEALPDRLLGHPAVTDSHGEASWHRGIGASRVQERLDGLEARRWNENPPDPLLDSSLRHFFNHRRAQLRDHLDDDLDRAVDLWLGRVAAETEPDRTPDKGRGDPHRFQHRRGLR